MAKHPNWDYTQTIQRIKAIEDNSLEEFARIGYMLGGRINELLSLQSNNVHLDGIIIRTTIKTLKTRKGNHIFREIPNDIKAENYFGDALFRFSQLKDTSLKQYLGLGGERNIQIKMKKQIGIVPHSLRHLRATHMGKRKIPGTLHQNTAPYLTYYFGWSSLSVASSYIDRYTINDALDDYHEKKNGGF